MSAAYEALRNGAGLWDRSAWHLRRFTGEGRLEFLHKYTTQEVRVDPGRGAYACCLTVKGAMKGDLWVYVRSDDLLVVTTAAAAAGLFKHLGRYALFDKVTMTDLAEESTLRSVWGPRAGAAIASLVGADLTDLAHLEHRTLEHGGHELVVARNDLADTPGWDLILPLAAAAPFEAALLDAGAVRVDEEAIAQVRIEAGIPLFGADMGEATIPIEAGLEARAINYDKGCYIGQEVIARIHHRGRVNRHLLGFRIDADQVETPSALIAGEKEAGQLTSVVHSPRLGGALIGIGIIHRKYMEPGTELRVGDADGPLATVCSLPFAAG